MLQILRYDIGDDFFPVFGDENEMVVQTEHRMVVPVSSYVKYNTDSVFIYIIL